MTSNKQILIDWIQKFIVNMNICPFAKNPWEEGQVDLYETKESVPEIILNDFQLCLEKLESNDKLTTSLFYMPELDMDYLDFNDFSLDFDDCLAILGLTKKYQLVVFHPEFYFEETLPSDECNFVNRSPFPMIHILNTKDIDMALISSEDAEKISYNNEEKIKKMPIRARNELFWFLKRNEF